MKPQRLATKIFLDGGDPQETREAIQLLGFLDGQTTNPTLISKNPAVKARFERGEKFTSAELLGFYQSVVKELSALMPSGSISIEVYADARTDAQTMLHQGRKMHFWIPNAHIKFPVTWEGLIAAKLAVKEGMRVNMTLCFTQAQAAAVHSATAGAARGQVLVSPFVGRLDDRGKNGMDLIANIIRMYRQGDQHVEVLTASVRSLDHLLHAIALGSDIVSCPLGVLREWAEGGLNLPAQTYAYSARNLLEIPYRIFDLDSPWQNFNIVHELTDKGMERFANDWNALVCEP